MALLVQNPLSKADVRDREEFDLWARKIPWRRKWYPTPIFLPGDPMDRGAWWNAVHGVTKSQTQLSI